MSALLLPSLPSQHPCTSERKKKRRHTRVGVCIAGEPPKSTPEVPGVTHKCKHPAQDKRKSKRSIRGREGRNRSCKTSATPKMLLQSAKLPVERRRRVSIAAPCFLFSLGLPSHASYSALACAKAEKIRHGKLRHVKKRQETSKQHKTREINTRRQDRTGHGKTRQVETRLDKTRQD